MTLSLQDIYAALVGNGQITVANAATTADPYVTASVLAQHTTNHGNPHAVTASQIGLGNVNNTADLAKPVSNPVFTYVSGHTANTANPHAVTAAQVGLGAVANLAPLDMPISNAALQIFATLQANVSVKAAAADVNVFIQNTTTTIQSFQSNIAALAARIAALEQKSS